MAALISIGGAYPADAYVVNDAGAARPQKHHWKPPPVSTGILATPSPTQPPYPATIGGGAFVLTAVQVAGYARRAGFPESIVPTMVAIAARESGYNAHAINLSSGACGLWQIYICPGIQALNPATNAALAYAKYEASGLTPWGGAP